MAAKAADRFLHAVDNLTGGDRLRIGLAVSGGPDSLALLLLAQASMPGRVTAATVDHELRPEAAAEARYVAGICAQHGIAHQILTPAAPITGSIQSAARKTRYALLDQWANDSGCAWIATAHHADDQLETMLMRLARGSGLNGMAAIRARNGRIIRPLLGFDKAELEQICADAGIKPVRDPSNENADFDRVAMRNWLAASPHPLDPARAVRTACALADAAEALDAVAADMASERIGLKGDIVHCHAADLPRELQRRLLFMALRHIDPVADPRGELVDAALEKLSVGERLTIGNILCDGGPIWQFSAAPPRRTA